VFNKKSAVLFKKEKRSKYKKIADQNQTTIKSKEESFRKGDKGQTDHPKAG